MLGGTQKGGGEGESNGETHGKTICNALCILLQVAALLFIIANLSIKERLFVWYVCLFEISKTTAPGHALGNVG